MNLEELKGRMALLQKDRDTFIANVHAIDGAIQECGYWIGVAQAKAAEEVKPVEAPDVGQAQA